MWTTFLTGSLPTDSEPACKDMAGPGGVRVLRAALLFLVGAALHAQAQLAVRVGDNQPTQVSAEKLASLPRHSAVLTEHENHTRYEGVLLRDLLALAGVSLTGPARGKQLSTYVSAVGKDGYQVVYALAELDPSLSDNDVLLADKREGQALRENEGPYRLVAPRDKRAARSVKMLQEIDVVQLRK